MNTQSLNAMFNKKSNTAFNNILFKCQIIAGMHEQMNRLYLAAKILKKIEGQSEIARLLNQSPQVVKNWESRGISKEGLLLAQKIIGCSAEWIESESGEMCFVSVPFNASNAEPAPKLGAFLKIPVVGHAQLGDNGHWYEMEYPVGHGDGYVLFPTKDKNAYALRCTGDSMKPRIKNGEFVVVEPNREPIPGDDVLVKSIDGRVMVKTLLYTRDGRVHLISVNEAHPPQSLSLDEIDKMHPIAAVVNNALWIRE